ncbi:hypothetical protein NDU88_001530 [Pleurodeles waltl]|uniref:Uncharacterized protein n=1 Tax=Pleurodeles waltl TaxID=8319 RepID=A0AAV7NCQ1_PLEWA|nr:hypothetical protein NDU88_001530 [Pleurodeles waltl]
MVFYALTMATGVWAAWKSKKEKKSRNQIEIAIVGGRNMTFFVGLFTTVATWVGGAYINGTAEIVYLPSRGLAWVTAPLSFSLTFVIGGLFFIKPMREKKYVTMMDPLQETYGNTMGSALFIPPLLGDIFWFASILASLGATVSVILDVKGYLAIVISACTVITYTLLGGLYSVAYTDVIQLIFMVLSLWTCVPFALMNPATENIVYTAIHELYQAPWIGKLDPEYIARWLDDLVYLALGSIAWQVYFQRVLAASSTSQAQLTSYIAGFIYWNQTSYGLPSPTARGESSMVLAIVLQYLCPTLVSVAGLGAIAAAVMSSADSSLLSASSMFAHNIYKKIFRKKASEAETLCIMRISMVVFGSVGTGLAFLSSSIYDLWFLSGELVYAVLFPQLCCALFIPGTNTYGSAAGFTFGFVLRLLAGENALKLPPAIHYPGCRLVDGTYIQLFPFKTFIMLCSLVTIILVSYVTTVLFRKNIISTKWDVCGVAQKSRASLSLSPSEDHADQQASDLYLDSLKGNT